MGPHLPWFNLAQFGKAHAPQSGKPGVEAIDSRDRSRLLEMKNELSEYLRVVGLDAYQPMKGRQRTEEGGNKEHWQRKHC